MSHAPIRAALAATGAAAVLVLAVPVAGARAGVAMPPATPVATQKATPKPTASVRSGKAKPRARPSARPSAPSPAPSPAVKPAAQTLVPVTIAIENTRNQVVAGDPVTYTIVMHNNGTEPQPLTISVIPPPILTGLAATDGGKPEAGAMTWAVTVPAGGESRVRLAGRLAENAMNGRVAVTACGTAAGGATPLVCATDMDDLRSAARRYPWIWPLAGLGVAGLLAAAWFLWRRRRRRSAAAAITIAVEDT